MVTLNPSRAAAGSAHPTLIAVAWGAMLLPACVPWIWSLWTGHPMPSWMNWLACVLTLVLWLLALTLSSLRPLRGYVLALLALTAADAVRNELIESAAYTTWTTTAGWGPALVADRALRWFAHS
ncbi:MAG: hypothetical protein M3380_00215 [Chloroflexota bacterium]|nr:hypothetical protein [Chloroflexota bacterium]